jgi:hypothetical protein
MSAAFVLAVVACAAVVALVAFVAREAFSGYPPPRLPAGSTLAAREQAFVAACADALFPPSGPIPLSGTEAGLVAYMDAYVARCPRTTRALIRLLFAFAEYGPWVFGPRRGRFTRLDQAARLAALEAMSKSPIYFRRIAFLSLRTMLSMGYLANAQVARQIGMLPDAAPFERVPPPPAASGPSEAAHTTTTDLSPEAA